MFILHAIKLYKTDLGTSPLYCGLSRRVNGEKRWSLEYLVVTYAGFYFWNVGTQRTTHQELYKVYFNGMFMIYLFIFWRKNRNISIKCHNWTYFYYWDLKMYECQCDLMWTNLHSSLNEQLINSLEMLFQRH